MTRAGTAATLDDVGRNAIARATRRLIPFLILIYFFNFLDRVNVGYAALTMNRELGLTATAFGFGAGLFFIGYLLFEVPSNLIMHRVGAKIWLSRIMVSWGIVSGATAFVSSETQFFLARFLLGFAEAGLFPGVILYLTYWFPARERGRITALFLLAIPLSSVIGSPISTIILQRLNGFLGLSGWRVMFLAEGIPAVVLGIVSFFVMTNRPETARWLSEAERTWLVERIADESRQTEQRQSPSLWRSLADVRVALLSVVYFGVVYGLYALSFFLPQLVAGLAKDFGTKFSFIEVGLISAVPFAFGGLAMWWIGRHSDRTGERIWHTAAPAFVAAAGLLIALAFSTSPYALMAGLIVLAMGVFGAIPSFWSLPSAFLAGTGLAGGIGLINAVGNLSGFAGPYVTGWLKDLTGDFRAGLLLVAVMLAVAGFTTVLLRRATPGKARATAAVTATSGMTKSD